MADTTRSDITGIKFMSGVRRKHLSTVFENKSASILEIGALEHPLFLASEGNVFFADHFTTEECREAVSGKIARSPEDIVEVDYVLAGKTLKEATGRTFDLVVASHVIEHVPDIIGWLKQIEEVTEVGGHLYLAVPDRRFTFDYFRNVNDSVDMIQAFDEKRVKPTAYNIMKHLYYATHPPLRAPEAWARKYPKRLVPRIAFGDAVNVGKAQSQQYTDVHCWVFTDESFSQAMWDLARGGFTRWTIVDLQPPQQDQNEFRVLMRKK